MELKALEVTRKALFGRTCTEKVYLKSEADKVIQEKDAKILALDAEVLKQKHHASLFFDERNYAETQLRHANYKRCMAMARWCDIKAYYTEAVIEDDIKAEWFGKWSNKWFELADTFKEAK